MDAFRISNVASVVRDSAFVFLSISYDFRCDQNYKY
jgi:hypothetical protein